VRAARRADVADIELLIELLALATPEQVLDVVTSVFPDEDVPDRGRLVVFELFESGR